MKFQAPRNYDLGIIGKTEQRNGLVPAGPDSKSTIWLENNEDRRWPYVATYRQQMALGCTYKQHI